jgi:ATP-dependent Zn protease
LKKALARRHSESKVTYEYRSNYEIKLTLPTLLANLLSVVFIAAFFSRSSSMTGGVKGGSNVYEQLLGKKKGFEVITNTTVRFADVAGLDESKV